jgi:hypothetical protein
VSWLSLVSVGLPTTGSVSLNCLAAYAIVDKIAVRLRWNVSCRVLEIPHLKRVFGVEIEQCKRGGGTLKITACIETPEVIAQIPDYLQRRSAPEGPCARGPPPQRGDEEERLGSAVADFIVDNFLTRVHRRDGEGDKERSDN